MCHFVVLMTRFPLVTLRYDVMYCCKVMAQWQLTPIDPSYYDELEHLDIQSKISAPSGRVMWRPLESQILKLLCKLTNNSLWGGGNQHEITRTRRWKQEGMVKQDDKVGKGWIPRTEGMLCTDLILDPELLIINVAHEKLWDWSCWRIVDDDICMPADCSDTTWCLEEGETNFGGVAERKSVSLQAWNTSSLTQRGLPVGGLRIGVKTVLITNVAMTYESVTPRAITRSGIIRKPSHEWAWLPLSWL